MTNSISNLAMPPSKAVVLERLKASGLLADEDLAQSASLRESLANEPDGRSLADALIAHGRLTPFQATAVCEDRLRDLSIGNYQVIDRLGGGGMGTVYLARHRHMKRVVAIKVLFPSLNENPVFVQRFQREIEAVARLSHPNIIVAHDADVSEAGHYLVMEYIHGSDLDRLVRQRGPLSWRLAATLVLQAARGMAYAHSQGIIHRDIKPANLLLDGSGVVKITDLGLARPLDLLNAAVSDEASLTRAGGILGTVEFMPPEQAFNPSKVDHRADIYSLGCTLFFLLTGRPPYTGETPLETMLCHRQDPIPSLLNLHPDVPLGLDDLFQRMVAKQSTERLADMSAVARTLEQHQLTFSDAELSAALKRIGFGGLLGPMPAIGTLPSLGAATIAADDQSDRASQRSAPPAVFGRDRHSLNVLIADASRTARAHIRNTLAAHHFSQFVEVADGGQAFDALTKQQFDLVVTGFNLAHIDGGRLIGLIRQTPRLTAIPVILVTSETDHVKLDNMRRLGAAAIIDKSFPKDEVGATIERLFPAATQTPP